MALLFRNHKDLLEEFTYFLPDAQAPAQVTSPRTTLDHWFYVHRCARILMAFWDHRGVCTAVLGARCSACTSCADGVGPGARSRRVSRAACVAGSTPDHQRVLRAQAHKRMQRGQMGRAGMGQEMNIMRNMHKRKTARRSDDRYYGDSSYAPCTLAVTYPWGCDVGCTIAAQIQLTGLQAIPAGHGWNAREIAEAASLFLVDLAQRLC